MRKYTMIDSDAKLSQLQSQWKEKGITIVAMDFEGEFNLHIYGEHLCLIQLFDGSAYTLVDPFALSKDALKAFLEDGSVLKVMFDCASDSALVRKQYDILLEGVYDIRVCALALGYIGNLTGLVERYIPEAAKPNLSSKKKNQMTNWLVRPLKNDQIEYALSDVEHLLVLKQILDIEVAEKGLTEKVALEMQQAGKSKGPDKPGWTKFSSWKYLSREEKVFLKHFFLARDELARKYNVPAVRILEKHLLLQMAKDVPTSDADFHVYCNNCNVKKLTELTSKLKSAKVNALAELGR